MTTRPISVEEALKVIQTLGVGLRSGEIGVGLASGRVAASAIFAPRDMPPFDNSQMDGYALAGLPPETTQWTVVGETPAGAKPSPQTLTAGEAHRIFTGAPIPPGTDAIVMQEKVTGTHEIRVEGPITPGQFIRRQGSDFAKGDMILEAGDRISPAAVGLMTSLGIEQVPIVPMPRIGMFTSGDELVPPGTVPLPHQLIEGNSSMLIAALQQLGIAADAPVRTTDDPVAMKNALTTLFETCDVIITTGGVSVGDYDFLKTVLADLGVTTLFWQVRQRPGKPLLLGKRANVLLLGLPGNPVSALVCFYVYAWPLLCILYGDRHRQLRREHHPLLKPASGIPDLTQFLRAKITADGVLPLEGQRSDQLRAFVEANCLIQLPEGTATYEAGTPVECILLPGT